MYVLPAVLNFKRVNKVHVFDRIQTVEEFKDGEKLTGGTKEGLEGLSHHKPVKRKPMLFITSFKNAPNGGKIIDKNNNMGEIEQIKVDNDKFGLNCPFPDKPPIFVGPFLDLKFEVDFEEFFEPYYLSPFHLGYEAFPFFVLGKNSCAQA